MCGPNDFTTVISDFGVCFIFNHPRSVRQRVTTSKGEGHGLRLVLNLEQYEYMAGPRASAGVKLLVYDRNDVPRLDDMGVAIPAGSNALIGIKMNKVGYISLVHL
jgi:hypothetical protein